MGYFFYASLKTKTELHAKHLERKYSGQIVLLNESYMYKFIPIRIKACAVERDSGWWCEIVPDGITSSGVSSLTEAIQADQFANIFYGMLRNDKYFEYGLLTVESEEFVFSWEELKEDLIKDPNYPGLVVAKEYLLESDIKLQPFSLTHDWVPYESQALIYETKNPTE